MEMSAGKPIENTTFLPDEGQLVGMFRMMVLIRRFEETVNELYMQGRIPSTLHLYIGQEAVATRDLQRPHPGGLCPYHPPSPWSFPG